MTRQVARRVEYEDRTVAEEIQRGWEGPERFPRVGAWSWQFDSCIGAEEVGLEVLMRAFPAYAVCEDVKGTVADDECGSGEVGWVAVVVVVDLSYLLSAFIVYTSIQEFGKADMA